MAGVPFQVHIMCLNAVSLDLEGKMQDIKFWMYVMFWFVDKASICPILFFGKAFLVRWGFKLGLYPRKCGSSFLKYWVKHWRLTLTISADLKIVSRIQNKTCYKQTYKGKQRTWNMWLQSNSECFFNMWLEQYMVQDQMKKCQNWHTFTPKGNGFSFSLCKEICIVKGSLVEKLPSYGDLKMQRLQYSNSSSSSAK